MLIACGVPDKLREFVGCFLRGPLLDGFSSMSSAKKRRTPYRRFFFFVAKLGLEPRQTEPESVVLPLHHLAISLTSIVRKSAAKVLLFSQTTK